MSSRIWSSVRGVSSGRGSASMPTAEQIWPGVQYPHWNASWSMNACCSACSVSPSASPSMVVISAPSCMTARVRHELILRPSQMELFTEQIEEDRPRSDVEVLRPTVHLQEHAHRHPGLDSQLRCHR